MFVCAVNASIQLHSRGPRAKPGPPRPMQFVSPPLIPRTAWVVPARWLALTTVLPATSPFTWRELKGKPDRHD
jgi:hypothetical protein